MLLNLEHRCNRRFLRWTKKIVICCKQAKFCIFLPIKVPTKGPTRVNYEFLCKWSILKVVFIFILNYEESEMLYKDNRVIHINNITRHVPDCLCSYIMYK